MKQREAACCYYLLATEKSDMEVVEMWQARCPHVNSVDEVSENVEGAPERAIGRKSGTVGEDDEVEMITRYHRNLRKEKMMEM
jgi:hypothetical protein